MSKAKLFTHHYMQDHNIKRYICRYCQSSYTQLSDSYVHIADAHPSYPVDIIEREYRPGFKLVELPIPSEAHYEQLRRIREEGPPKPSLKRESEPPSSPQKNKKISGGAVGPTVMLNSILGVKGAKATVSSISGRLSASSLLDEPLVNIGAAEGEESTEDPLSLDNEGCAVAAGGAGQVDSDTGSVNFDAYPLSNLR